VEAQTIGHALRGLSRISIMVERVDHDGKACGLTEDVIRNAVLYPLSSAIQVLNAPYTTLYVNTSSYFSPEIPDGFCVTHIHMQAFSHQEVTLDFSGRKVWEPIELWSLGAIVSSYLSNHRRRVAEYIEELAKKFVTDWNLDNQDKGQKQDWPG